MVLFLCRTKQAHIRALSNQFTRYYFQIHHPSPVIGQTKIGVVNAPTGSEFFNFVRFFAAPVQVKPKYEENFKGRPRMNEQISAQFVRLVTDEGHGVVSRHEALDRARRLNVDLVEVQPDGKPPVCKLMDYNKEMYVKQVKEKEQTKKKSDLVLRKGGLKEVRLTYKIDKHDLQTKADTVRRLAERGYRVKCMAVRVGKEEPNLGQEKQDSDKVKQEPGKGKLDLNKEKQESGKGKLDSGKVKQDSGKGKQDLGALLSRFSALINDFALVESGPKVEAKQAYVVVRHIKFGPLKKGPGKKTGLESSNINTSTESPVKDEIVDKFVSDSEEVVESDSTDDFDQDRTVKVAPETSNRYAATRPTNGPDRGSENRYTTMNPTGSVPGVRRRFDHESQNPGSSRQSDPIRRGLGEPASSNGMFGAPKPNTESVAVEVNRYKKGPPSDHSGPRGDFGRDNSNMYSNGVREKQDGFRR